MPGIIHLKLIVLGLSALWHPNGARVVKPDSRLDRSYQLAPVSVINGVQGLQYIPMTALYSEIPTVLFPKQISLDMVTLQSTPASVTSQGILPQKYYETSTPSNEIRTVQEPVLHPQQFNYERNLYNIRKNKQTLHMTKRPGHHGYGRKKIGGHSAYQKLSSVSVEPSIDITDQLQHVQNSFQSTTPAPVSTYGPAKVVDHQHKSRTHVTTYIRPKGHHPHPHYRQKDYRVYSHMHKGHIHSHHIPPALPIYKSQYYSSAKAIYPTALKPTAATFLAPVQDSSPDVQSFHVDSTHKSFSDPLYNHHAYGTPQTHANYIRFPDTELKKSLLNAYKSHQEEILANTRVVSYPTPLKSHSDLTQAIVKDSATINNYDASIPVKIPSKRPNRFEVKEILRNADVHFIDGTINDASHGADYQPQFEVHTQRIPYHGSEVQDANQAFALVPDNNVLIHGYGQGISNNHIDYYEQNGYPQDEELATADTVKVPVAVIKDTRGGTHSIGVQRPETPKSKTLIPSSSNSDWIPMSGKLFAQPDATIAKNPAADSGGKYIAGLLNTRTEATESTRIITADRSIGDIISGKIPREYSPFKHSGGDIITGKIVFGESKSEMDRRKGSVIDDGPAASDSSNHVVSSMIKFS